MSDASTLRAAIDRLATELADRLDSTVEVFDHAPLPEQAPAVFVYVSADGAVIEAEQFRVQMRLVVSGQIGNEEAQSRFVTALDMIEAEMDAASLGDQATAGWAADLNAWVCTWTVEIPRAYA